MAITETIEVTVGEPETGLWCEACLLPSLTAIPVTMTLGNSLAWLTALKVCTDCGRNWREDY